MEFLTILGYVILISALVALTGFILGYSTVLIERHVNKKAGKKLGDFLGSVVSPEFLGVASVLFVLGYILGGRFCKLFSYIFGF